ncbi:hypothetical protein N7468_010131 [Penicillium chermesinum]|uniref:DUF159 domain protein n=1 Tax=Penicillium chermesinum TaxID=63820 RepID=A0A9W9NC53_9EURO|nr:uncharacterized protein N7468_010131 [Penicillium chermesinum]KAJ5217123.1 hypothetical protein N7468_010131 [Penicillium chermesinum]KAJ6171257.1 hypothetical protein N7470_000324 [Penicillium chermesinum]
MCGRYALGLRLAYVRQRLTNRGMQVDDTPADDQVRETYNFAPGNFGVVYRAEIPGDDHQRRADANEQDEARKETSKSTKDTNPQPIKYKLQSMKWGLIPFWTKRQPDYGSLMRTINCRDDSLIEDRGMWTTMKRHKRCIVVCQGFYEWLKKGPGGKDRIPHYVKRKDGELMCFAGLWDCVSYEGSDEKLYTYTIITTSSNQYLKFLHDRMPVILDAGSDAMKTWLDPSRTHWSKELQSLLKPYDGELECYQVSKEVGKVGNNSPDFIIPIDSKDNKNNIANFFASPKKKDTEKADTKPQTPKVETEMEPSDRLPVSGVKREHTPDTPNEKQDNKKPKVLASSSPQKGKTRSATHNSPRKTASGPKPTDGSQRITNFFKK